MHLARLAGLGQSQSVVVGLWLESSHQSAAFYAARRVAPQAGFERALPPLEGGGLQDLLPGRDGFRPYCAHSCAWIWHRGRSRGSPRSDLGFDEAEEESAGDVAEPMAPDPSRMNMPPARSSPVEGGYPGGIGWHSAGCGRLIPIQSHGTCSHHYFPLWE